jgi:peptidoglycan/xylan/chitin deacetylase (PgdA/CDA1 family)
MAGLKDQVAVCLGRLSGTRRLASIASQFFAKTAGGYILAYHRISRDRFKEHLAALSPDRPIPLDELLQRYRNRQTTAGLFAITFDDGYGDTVADIAGFAITQDLPVTFYLATGFLNGHTMPGLILENLMRHMPPVMLNVEGKKHDLSLPLARSQFFQNLKMRMHREREGAYFPFIDKIITVAIQEGFLREKDIFATPAALTWDGVSQFSRYDNIRFESHGISHQAVVALADEDLEHELRQSKEQIISYSNREVKHFCYPYGDFSSIGNIAPKIVSKYYESAVTMNRGRLNKNYSFMLPRMPFYEKDTKELAMMKILTR